MIKVGVLLGGKSIEREVSFNSGRTICDHLDSNLYKVIPLFQTAIGDLFILPWTFLYRGKIADFEHRLEVEAKKITWDDLPALIDFMYIAVHGKYAEDGKLQAILELLKIPYLGTKVFGSALGMNKILQNKYLAMHNIKTPKGFAVNVGQVVLSDLKFYHNQMQLKNINFPIVVKPQAEGSSLGVFVAHNDEELLHFVEKSCFIAASIGQDIMIEEKLEGMEFNTIVITDSATGDFVALPPTEIMLRDGVEIFDYHHKYMPGVANKRTPAHCSQEYLEKIKETCVATAKALYFENIARIDGFLTKDGEVVILDSNPISGMAPSSFVFRQAAEVGIGHGQLINHLIKTELKNYKIESVVKEKQMQIKKRIVVLLGGSSNEREISLESGRNVCYKLSDEKYEIVPVFVDIHSRLYVLTQRLLVCTSTKEIASRLDEAKAIGWSDLKKIADFVFIALHGGLGENGTVQGTLEMLGLPYNGSSVFASALCMDKYKTGQFLKFQGFDTPRSFLFSKFDFVAQNFDNLYNFLKSVNFSYIVKPHDDGCSVMVSSPQNKENLQESLTEIFATKEFALIEEKIIGMELTVGVLGNKDPEVLIPSEAISKKIILSMEEKFLPGAGENQTPARLPGEDIEFVRQIIKEAFVVIGCQGYSRIDCFFQNEGQSTTGKRRVVILEVNTLPALTPATCLFHQAAEIGIRPAEFLDKIIELGVQAHPQDEVVSVDTILQQHERI
ncbi:ATP-grasp domain-containing protein [Candidatus Dependentiae bacterium]|nr:ATP-grasp domain-containing protein [Candidatus Dependentiae bacterium]